MKKARVNACGSAIPPSRRQESLPRLITANSWNKGHCYRRTLVELTVAGGRFSWRSARQEKSVGLAPPPNGAALQARHVPKCGSLAVTRARAAGRVWP